MRNKVVKLDFNLSGVVNDNLSESNIAPLVGDGKGFPPCAILAGLVDWGVYRLPTWDSTP